MFQQRFWSVTTLTTAAVYFLALLLFLVLAWHPGVFVLSLWVRGVLSVGALAAAMLVALIVGAVVDAVVRSRSGEGFVSDGNRDGSFE